METYLIPHVEWNERDQQWHGYIEERRYADGESIMGWWIRESPSPFEVLEAVTTEWVRMTSNTINYYLENERK